MNEGRFIAMRPTSGSVPTRKHSLWSSALLAAGLIVALSPSAPAQSTKSNNGGDEKPDLFEIGLFGGGSFFRNVSQGLGTKLNNGGAAGFRVTENFWRYVGLEQAFTYSANNLTFNNPVMTGEPNYGFGVRLYQWSLNPVFYLKPRGSAVRPFFTVGASAMDFRPTDTATGLSRQPFQGHLISATGVHELLLPGLNYGGGVKWHLTDSLGVRFDIRGLMSRNPTFSLPDAPGGGLAYIPFPTRLHGVQTTAGITWYFGQKAAPPPPPPPPPPPQALPPLNGGTLSAGGGTLCQGRPIVIRSSGVSDPAGRAITYKWRVNGQAAGGNSPELQFTPDHAGSYSIELEVEAPNTEGMPVRTAKANTLSISVQEYRAPTVSGCSAVPSQLNYGDSAALSASATGSACSEIRFKWTASEGTIANDTSAQASFDSKSVRFEQGGKIQSKTVTVTGTVTDDRGASASCDTQIKVDYTPSSIRFSDLIFSKGSARVNNCAKRILLEEVAAKAADPDYEIVLIGHYDKDEAPKGKLPKGRMTLDEQRVLDSFAVLTAGKGTCGNVDPSRIKVDWVADDQVSDFQPGICGTSARPAAEERRGAMVSTADQNRRVEVWLVPKGTKMPAAFKEAKQLDEKAIKKTGCPK
jgi:flagellar motor protein MotB